MNGFDEKKNQLPLLDQHTEFSFPDGDIRQANYGYKEEMPMSESFDEQSLAMKFHDHKIPIRQSSLPDNEYEGESKIVMNLNETNSERYKNLLKPTQMIALN